MASRIVRFMRRQNLPGALCNRGNRRHNLASMRMAEGFTVCGAIPRSNERRYGACSIPCQTHWRHNHARPYALGELVCLAVGASRAGHRHPHPGLDPAAAARASAETALTPHFHRRRTELHPTEAPTGLDDGCEEQQRAEWYPLQGPFLSRSGRVPFTVTCRSRLVTAETPDHARLPAEAGPHGDTDPPNAASAESLWLG